MPDYRTPLRDIRFLLEDVLDIPRHYAALTGGAALDEATFRGVLDEAAKFTESVLQPLNRSADATGCRLADGEVTTPPGFRDAYRQFVAGGWSGISGPAEYGGMDLPPSLEVVVQDMMTTANMAFGLYPGLSQGAVHALEAHGSHEQKALYLPRLLSGEWTGTMCLTEPHAGSDVGLVRTRAEPHADGSYRISGTKIFISCGEQDLTSNIVHLVLARLPGAPEGTRGISMFIVPKHLPDATGNPGPRNAVHCASIEHKMGIHGSATCVMNFDDATGFLVGDENRGMKYMFTMMNAARLFVGIQGVGCAEAARQASLGYAAERLQMRALGGPVNPDGPADPIIHHPDVRRMLLTQRALVMGSRAIAYLTGMESDRIHRGADAAARAEGQALVDLLTPIAKGFVTEVALESTIHAQQVYGGHGYIAEHGVEQHVRDCRITLIYEGTNQIQALDLLGRKVLQDQGRTLELLVARILADLAACPSELAPLSGTVRPLVEGWRELAMKLAGATADDADALGAAAMDFMMYSGYTLMGWLWVRMAAAAEPARDGEYARAIRHTARFYVERLLPRAELHARTALGGPEALMEVSVEQLLAV